MEATTPFKATFKSHKVSLPSHGLLTANHKTSPDLRGGDSPPDGRSSTHILFLSLSHTHTNTHRELLWILFVDIREGTQD